MKEDSIEVKFEFGCLVDFYGNIGINFFCFFVMISNNILIILFF